VVPEASAPVRFALRSRRVVTPTGVIPAVVEVAAGRIVDIHQGAPASLPPDLVVEDLGELALLPGAVDLHVHLNEPGRTDWEGFATGTRAAAAGGITTLVDMPLNSSPVTVTVAALAAKRAAAAGQIHVDVGFHGGVVPGHEEDVEPLLDAGVLGMKAFLVDSGLAEFAAADAGTLRAAMRRLARRGVPLLAHAEVDTGDAPPRGAPDRYASWLASRPERFELAAIELLLDLVAETGAALHVVHLATATALPRLAAARAAGLPVTVETCPHYLTFAAEEIPDADPRFKCAPPLRERAHREALWRGLADGVIDLVASDHSPAPPALRALDAGDLFAAWGGIASLELSLAATWTGARARGHGLADLARWTATAPAARVGLAGRKGAIVPGADADLVVFAPEAAFRVTGASLQHRHPQTPYEGRELVGVVERTWLRGHEVFRRGAPTAPPVGALLSR
jgi:allantoinase